MTDNEKVRLTLRRNGSILVEGPVVMIGPDGEEMEVREKFGLCRCGASKNKPYCDGAHKDCNFISDPV
jgi:CDGSH-type Zn-finger protein